MKRSEVVEILIRAHVAPKTANDLDAELPHEAEPHIYAQRLVDAADERRVELPAPVLRWAAEVLKQKREDDARAALAVRAPTLEPPPEPEKPAAVDDDSGEGGATDAPGEDTGEAS